MKGHRGNPGLKGRLVDKSVDAYVLALETINRISIQYRLEAFCYLLCNAWELLLKAKILQDTGDKNAIFYRAQKGKPKKSLTLRESLIRVYQTESDPERRNIERIAELRDEAVHLVFSGIPRDALCLFQAGVLNYHRRLDEWFHVSLSDRVHVGMMSIVYDMQPQHSDLSDKQLRRELGKDAADYLTRFCAEIRQEFDQLQRPAEFSIGIEYRLVLTDKPQEADIVLSKGVSGKETTRFIEVPKDPSKSHPLRQKEVLEQVNSLLGGLLITSYDLQCVIKVHGIKLRSEYFYKGKVKGSPSQYSLAYVKWLIKQFQNDPAFFQKARSTVKRNP